MKREFLRAAGSIISLTFAGLLLAIIMSCGYDSSAPYSPVPSAPDGLWTAAASAPAVLKFDQSQLASGGNRVPATAITTPSAALFDLNGIAFASDGTMWVTSDNDARLVAFAPASLTRSGGTPASIVISANDGSLNRPVAIAFDKQHRLWVANFGNHTVVRYEPSQIAQSGAAAPTLSIDTGVNPSSLAFDAEGNLWVASIQANKVFSYSRLQQNTTGVTEPQIVLSTNGTALQHPSGLAFDATGNLWVTSVTASRVEMFSPAQLTTTGAPAATVTISSNNSSINEPTALAFDNDGSLWVLAGGDGALSKYTHGALQQTGSPAPSLSLSASGYNLFWNIAFWPKPTALPLN